MRTTVAMLFVVSCLILPCGVALGDIPPGMDYHYKHEQPGIGNWVQVIDWDPPLGPLGPPVWEDEPNNPRVLLEIPNIAAPLTKHLYLEIDYVSRINFPTDPNTLLTIVNTPGAIDLVDVVDNGSVSLTWHWTIRPQPDEETIKFPSIDYYDLVGMDRIEVGTRCIPVPAAGFVGAGLVLSLMVRRPGRRE